MGIGNFSKSGNFYPRNRGFFKLWEYLFINGFHYRFAILEIDDFWKLLIFIAGSVDQGSATGRATRPGNFRPGFPKPGFFRPGEKFDFETRIFKFSTRQPARNPETRAGKAGPLPSPGVDFQNP